MTNDGIPLLSDEILTDIEHHFRVTAGPGAGKTHWLANHIRHVAQVSNRLSPCARIGVISYTNVAVREILGRIGDAASATDVSTIHSFLFRNLVRPYLHFLKGEDGDDIAAHHLVDTHSEHFVAHTEFTNWLTDNKRRQLLVSAYERSRESLKSRLRELTVRIDDTGETSFTPRKQEAWDSSIADLLTPEKLLSYKRQYWARGIIDHEDVLYFAYRLLQKFSPLRQFLSARFPYLFIDEFQDTLPVQAALVRWLAEAGTTVGVIGDPEQAIYGFLDASPTHFHNFNLTGHRKYQINGNRRSTASIVSLLNRLRADGMQQEATHNQSDIPPVVYSGSLGEALLHARSKSAFPSTMLVLARNHRGVLRARQPERNGSTDQWSSIETADAERCRFLQHLATAADLAQRQFYDIAIQRLVQGISTRSRFREPLQFNGDIDIVARRSLALLLLEFFISKHDELLQASLLDVYKSLESHIPNCLPGLKLKPTRKSKFQDTAAACRYRELVDGLRTTEETRLIRTIHQAKGSEARAVFVVLEKEAIDHILTPQAEDDECRITYVALSRAMDELYLFCPDGERLSEFEVLGMTAQQIGCALLPPQKTKSRPRKRKTQ